MAVLTPYTLRDGAWWRLFAGGRRAGYLRLLGQSECYSSDGYGWTGEPLEYDYCARELGLFTRSGEKLYHGDWVDFMEDSGEICVHLMLCGAEAAVWHVPHRGGKLQPYLREGAPPRESRIVRTRGTHCSQSELDLSLRTAMQQPRSSPPWWRRIFSA